MQGEYRGLDKAPTGIRFSDDLVIFADMDCEVLGDIALEVESHGAVAVLGIDVGHEGVVGDELDGSPGSGYLGRVEDGKFLHGITLLQILPLGLVLFDELLVFLAVELDLCLGRDVQLDVVGEAALDAPVDVVVDVLEVSGDLRDHRLGIRALDGVVLLAAGVAEVCSSF